MTEIFTLLQNAARVANLAPDPEGFITAWTKGGHSNNPAAAPGAEQGPYGMSPAIEFSVAGGVVDPNLVFERCQPAASLNFPAAGTWSIFSCFFKRPTAGTPCTGFVMDIRDETHARSHTIGFRWSGTGFRLVRDIALDINPTGVSVHIRQVGPDGWYRAIVAFQVGVGDDVTAAGNVRRFFIRQKDDVDLQSTVLWAWGALIEQRAAESRPNFYLSNLASDDALWFSPHAMQGKLSWQLGLPAAAVAGTNSVKIFGRAGPLDPWAPVLLTKTDSDMNADHFKNAQADIDCFPNMKLMIVAQDAATPFNATLWH